MEMGDELEDASLITFLDNDKVDFGKPLSSYAKSRSLNPIRFAVSKRCVDGRHIKLMLKASCDGMDGILEQPVTLIVENGIEIGGMITQNLTLYPDVHYIVTTSLAIPEGVTLTIKPGTILKFKDNTGISIANGGHILAHGTPDSLIIFTKADFSNGTFYGVTGNEDTLRYCSFRWFDNVIGGICQSDYYQNKRMTLEHCIISNNTISATMISQILVSQSTIFDNIRQGGFSNDVINQNASDGDSDFITNSNICNNQKSDEYPNVAMVVSSKNEKDIYRNNNIFGNQFGD